MSITRKENLQSDLNGVLLSVEGKIDPQMIKKIQEAMDNLLTADTQLNRELLTQYVDAILILGDSKALHKEDMKKISAFLESLKDFLIKDLTRHYEWGNMIRTEKLKINAKIADMQERQGLRVGRK